MRQLDSDQAGLIVDKSGDHAGVINRKWKQSLESA
jgi:hypothetical protein